MIITWNRVTFVSFFELTCNNIDCINTNLQWIRFKVALESSKPMISSLKSKFELSKCWNLEHVGRRKPKKWHPLAKVGFFMNFMNFASPIIFTFLNTHKKQVKEKMKLATNPLEKLRLQCLARGSSGIKVRFWIKRVHIVNFTSSSASPWPNGDKSYCTPTAYWFCFYSDKDFFLWDFWCCSVIDAG